MSRTRFALTSLLAAVLALTPIIQPMAIYADVQQEAVETLGEDALPDPAPDAAPAPQDDAADAGQIAPSAEDAPAPDGAASEEVPEESADDLSDTPSSDQSMAYSWRYEAGELIASEEGPRDGTAFRSARVTLPSGATAWGIDVSYANGAINWTQVKRAGVDFAILRLGYGWGGDDAQFLNNVAGARANGIKIGVYLYSYAWDAASATREAQWTLQVLQRAGLNPSDLDLPVFYDIENVSKKTGKPAGVDDNNQYREITGGPAGFAAMATAWANVIKGAGFTPGMYTSKTWWETYLTDAVFGQWQRWVAQWNSTNTYKGTYSTWQYTSDGTVAGISGRVDLNYSYDPRFAKPDTSNVKTSLTRSGDAVTAIISGFGENPTNVSFALTTPAGAVTWHQAYKQPDGSWKTNLSLASVFDRAGSYRVMAYGTFGFYTYDLTGASLQVSQPSSSVSLLLEDGGLTAAASAWTMSPSNVAFMVTAPGGKTAWYQGVKGSNGTWAASIPAGTDFGSYGTYTAAAYATVGGKTDAYGTAKAVVTVPTVANNLKASDGRLVSSSAGWTLSPSNVAFRVDSPTGATRWYQGYRQSDGSWTASFNATADFGDWDTYSATTYATFAGSTKSYGSAVASLSPGVIRVDASASGTDVALAASGWAVAPSNVAFRVELPSGDVTWVQAYRQADGAWTARFSALKGYGQLGTYRATAYATFGGRTSTFGDEATVKVTLGDIQVSATARNADIALKASGWDQAPTNVAFAVKAPSGAVTWLQAYRQTDGSWSATASAASAFK
ncbi:MAG: GH25 family lysozyme, partial [Collinsella sp.]|nr:GH25 family lysozyme [Collinsella sp.]